MSDVVLNKARFRGKVCKKLFDFRFTRFCGMFHTVKSDIAYDPAFIGFFSTQ
jgi:hypothetical protein